MHARARDRQSWALPRLLLACGSLLAPFAAGAGSLSVSPVRLSLSAKQPVSSLVVHNDSSEPAVIQLDVVGWAQSAGADAQDQYDSTAELLATPPIFTIPAGTSRIVRIGLRRAPDVQRELAYRLFLEEVPPPLAPDFQGLRMALKIGVPVFVAASAKTRAELKWHAALTATGLVKLQLANSGNEHVKVTDLELSSGAGGTSSGLQHVSTYVLPGHSREWLVKLEKPVHAGVPLHLKAHSDTLGELSADLTLDPI